jgi:hypothetical protein
MVRGKRGGGDREGQVSLVLCSLGAATTLVR